MPTNQSRFYDQTTRADHIDWNLSSDEAQRMAAPHFDLHQPADRQRAFFAYLIETCGGLAAFAEAYGVSRDVMSAWVYEGRRLDDVEGLSPYGRSQVENTRKQLAHYQDEFDSLAANSPRWAELNQLGGLS
jgi:hypothetical protein